MGPVQGGPPRQIKNCCLSILTICINNHHCEKILWNGGEKLKRLKKKKKKIERNMIPRTETFEIWVLGVMEVSLDELKHF